MPTSLASFLINSLFSSATEVHAFEIGFLAVIFIYLVRNHRIVRGGITVFLIIPAIYPRHPTLSTYIPDVISTKPWYYIGGLVAAGIVTRLGYLIARNK